MIVTLVDRPITCFTMLAIGWNQVKPDVLNLYAYRFVVDISMTILWFQDYLLNIQGIGLTPEAPYCHLQV